jgi:hypothetical protein
VAAQQIARSGKRIRATVAFPGFTAARSFGTVQAQEEQSSNSLRGVFLPIRRVRQRFYMKRALLEDSPPSRVDGEKRDLLLRQSPAAVGANWALQYLDGLRRSGRSIEGGWPGTLPEARAQVLAALPQALISNGLRALEPQELVAATALAYAEARRNWQLATSGRGTTGKR